MVSVAYNGATVAYYYRPRATILAFSPKHSILALERAPNMYRTPSTSGEPLPTVRELSASCIVYVSILKLLDAAADGTERSTV